MNEKNKLVVKVIIAVWVTTLVILFIGIITIKFVGNVNNRSPEPPVTTEGSGKGSGKEPVPPSGEKKINYRVRKSRDDAASQVGAFSEYQNAVAEADKHKDEGYKVYDMEGNLIYTP